MKKPLTILRSATRLLASEGQILLGGQAVLEGVMMRSPNAYAVAVRRPDGDLAYLSDRVAPWTQRFKMLGLPIVRGAASLIQMMVIGIRALNFSAEEAFPEDHKEKRVRKEGEPVGGTTWSLYASLALAIVMAAGLFFVLPLALTELLKIWFPQIGGGVLYNLIDGVFRLIIFVLYILAISLMRDIRRLFMYHGAEHKVVHAWEQQKGMDVDTVQKYSVLHPRCGTSFLLFVMVVSIVVFCFIPEPWPLWGKALARIVLIPLIAGISYEVLRASARHQSNPLAKIFVFPGLMMQKLTTREPEDDMVRVAIAAYEKAAELEGGAEAMVL